MYRCHYLLGLQLDVCMAAQRMAGWTDGAGEFFMGHNSQEGKAKMSDREKFSFVIGLPLKLIPLSAVLSK